MSDFFLFVPFISLAFHITMPMLTLMLTFDCHYLLHCFIRILGGRIYRRIWHYDRDVPERWARWNDRKGKSRIVSSIQFNLYKVINENERNQTKAAMKMSEGNANHSIYFYSTQHIFCLILFLLVLYCTVLYCTILCFVQSIFYILCRWLNMNRPRQTWCKWKKKCGILSRFW